MKAISLWQPWLWAIMHAGKRLENRDWNCTYRGPVVLHASKHWEEAYVRGTMIDDILPELTRQGLPKPKVTMRMLRESGGHLLATAKIVGCLGPNDPCPRGQEAWDMRGGSGFGILLDEVKPLPTHIRQSGQPGLFNVPDKILQKSVGSHKCWALDCNQDVPMHLLMCKGHWWKVPAAIRARVLQHYKPGQTLETCSREWRSAAMDARNALRENEPQERLL